MAYIDVYCALKHGVNISKLQTKFKRQFLIQFLI